MRENEFVIYIYSRSYFEEPALILRAVELIDPLLAPYRLDYQLTDTDYVKIENRHEYIMAALKADNLYLCNNSPDHFFNLQGFLRVAIKRLNSHAYAYTHITVPGDESNVDAMNALVSSMGDTMRAYHMSVGSPFYKGNISGQQIMFSHRTVEEIPYGLPPLADFARYGLVDYQYPRFLGWINYWSQEIADAISFNYESDKHLFYKCFQTPLGSWVLQITKDPLDVNNPEHLDQIKKVYKRYPKVGRQDLLPENLFS